MTALTPRMSRVRFAGTDLRGLGAAAGQTVQLLVPLAGNAGTARRDYTVRRCDDDAATMDVDFALHADGPATRWARHATPGRSVGLLGPSGRPWVDPSADWHLFAGDETATPAILAMAESLPGTATAWCYLEVADAAEHQPVHGPAAVRWCHRGAAAPGTSTVLVDALRRARLPPGRGRVWLAGHAATVRRIRADLLDRYRIDRRDLYVRGFWGARTDPGGTVGSGGRDR